MSSFSRTNVKIVIAVIIVLPLVITGRKIAIGSRLRLLSDEALFREAFSRFLTDEVNGLSPDKMKRLGQAAVILSTYDDFTVTCRFDDGVVHDMPIEALGYAGGQAGMFEAVAGHTMQTFFTPFQQEYTVSLTGIEAPRQSIDIDPLFWTGNTQTISHDCPLIVEEGDITQSLLDACACRSQTRSVFTREEAQGTSIVVQDGRVMLVDGVLWPVRWIGTPTDGIKMMVSVDDQVGGKVALGDQTAFENPEYPESSDCVDGKIAFIRSCVRLLCERVSVALGASCFVARNPNVPVFLHIPKTAGHAIKQTLSQYDFGKVGALCTIDHTPIRWLTPTQKAAHYGNAGLIFTVLRNPYDRMISQYRFMCRANPVELSRLGFVASEVSSPNPKIRAEESAITKACLHNTSQLNAFVKEHVARLSQVTDEEATVAFDCHFIPQHVYASDVHHFVCNMTETKLFLSSHGFDVEALHELATYDHAVLDHEALTTLNEVYAKDFALCSFERHSATPES